MNPDGSSFQDWDTVVLKGNRNKKDYCPPGYTKVSVEKYGSGKNTNNSDTVSAKKLEDSDAPPPETISRKFSVIMQQKRLQMKMNQKDLAMKINQRVDIIQSYENGKAIPTPSVRNSIMRVLNISKLDVKS